MNLIKCIMTNSTCYKKTTTMNIKGVMWHSTGVNNPYLKRYVQPSNNDKNLLNLIGVNKNKNDWNHTTQSAGVNAFIGKLADGAVATIQTLPWNYKPWGCGKGSKGSCNSGWIQFEICQDNLANKDYFDQVYKEACELTAFLCKTYNIDPLGTVYKNGVAVPTILCHQDGYKLGMASNHSDVYNWFNIYNKTMDDVRNDVNKILKGEEEEMTQEQFNEMMNNYIKEMSAKPPSSWAEGVMNWGVQQGLIVGDEHGNLMSRKFITREEAMALLQRLYKKVK